MKTFRLSAVLAALFFCLDYACAAQANQNIPSVLPADWEAPRATPAYDWRHTLCWGVAGGTASGSGLSMRLWEESLGWQFTVLPFFFSTDDFLIMAGVERLRSLGKAPAQVPGPFGFSTRHWYLFASTFHSLISDQGNRDYMGSAGAGLGLELNRRASRFSLQLGVGPYLAVESSSNLEFFLMPLLEFSWHFGSPRPL